MRWTIRFLLAAAATVPLQLAEAAGPGDRTTSASPPCWHQAVVDGHQVQPTPDSVQCRDQADSSQAGASQDGTSPAAPGAGNRTIDKDEAAILAIINRYRTSGIESSGAGQ